MKYNTMIEPPSDELREKVGNKFMLACLIFKRAKELSNQYLKGQPSEKDPKFIAIATEEVFDGKVKANQNEF